METWEEIFCKILRGLDLSAQLQSPKSSHQANLLFYFLTICRNILIEIIIAFINYDT